MALVSEARSSLNPNAPVFIPAAFCQVEDFSSEWWELVKNSAWFREYWLSQHGEEDFDGSDYADVEFTDECVEAELDGLMFSSEAEYKADLTQVSDKDGLIPLYARKMDVITLLKNLNISKLPKERRPKSPPGPAKYREKPAKVVSPKCTPRRIQQPR